MKKVAEKTQKTLLKSSSKGLKYSSENSDSDDIRVLNSIKAGNARAFAHLVHKYQDFIYLKVLSGVGNKEEAKDLVQDIFLKVFEKLPLYKPTYTLNSWITSIAKNHLVDYIRRKKQGERMMGGAVMSLTGENGQEIDVADNLNEEYGFDSYEKRHSKAYDKISKLIHSLSDENKLLIQMFYLQKMRQETIAQQLGMTHGNVRVRLLRLRAKLNKMTGGENSLFNQLQTA